MKFCYSTIYSIHKTFLYITNLIVASVTSVATVAVITVPRRVVMAEERVATVSTVSYTSVSSVATISSMTVSTVSSVSTISSVAVTTISSVVVSTISSVAVTTIAIICRALLPISLVSKERIAVLLPHVVPLGPVGVVAVVVAVVQHIVHVITFVGLVGIKSGVGPAQVVSVQLLTGQEVVVPVLEPRGIAIRVVVDVIQARVVVLVVINIGWTLGVIVHTSLLLFFATGSGTDQIRQSQEQQQLQHGLRRTLPAHPH